MATDWRKDQAKDKKADPKVTPGGEGTSGAEETLKKFEQWEKGKRHSAPRGDEQKNVLIGSYGQQLQREREKLGWTQGQLAEGIGALNSEVASWEENHSSPDLAFRQKLAELFGKESQMQREISREENEQAKAVERTKDPLHRKVAKPLPPAPEVIKQRKTPDTEVKLPPEYKEEIEESSQATQDETVDRDLGEHSPQTDKEPTQDRQESSKVSANYGQQLQRERKQKRWTREQLGKRIRVSASEVASWEENRSYPNRIFRQRLAECLGKDIYRTSQTVVRDTSNLSSVDGLLQVRIHQERLTARNFTTIISALTELHTQCWLIQQGRFVHAIEYAQTHNEQFVEEANLVITSLTYNTPLALSFAPLDPKSIATALVVAIDGTMQANQRLIAVRIANQEKAEQIQQVAKRTEQEFQAKQQQLTIAAQKAAEESQLAEIERERLRLELERQRLTFQIEQEKQKLDLEKQQVAIQKEQLELVTMRMNYAIETANKMIVMLQPNVDQATRAMLVQTLLPSLLQLDSGQGLNLVLPAPQQS